MMSGTAYGVVLNDVDERGALAAALSAPPYGASPEAPVLYIKPRTCVATGGAAVRLDESLYEVELAATIALVFGRDVARAGVDEALDAVSGVCLALDISEPQTDYYRPAVRQRCRDGFLPIGAWGDRSLLDQPCEIVTHVDDTPVHRWSLDRLVRPVARLIADITGFMTLQAGDLLLAGLPGDAPRAGVGARVRVEASGLPSLETVLVREAVT